MEIWQNFHFLRPYWLALLILPLFYYLSRAKGANIASSWAKVCDENLLRFLLIKGDAKQRKTPQWLAYLISVLMVLAIAGPTWIKKDNPALSIDNPVMFLLNLSSDMWVKDVTPSRIVRAKYMIKDFTTSLKNTESGLLVYSHEPFVITPLTEDNKLIDNLLPAMQLDIMPKNGDRLDRAIDLAVERMKQSLYKQGNLIVLTSDVGERFDAALESASRAADEGFEVNVINISGQENEKLHMIADKGRGMYLNYQQSEKGLVDKINNITAKQIKQSQNMQVVWEDLGYYLFWLPSLLLLYYFRKGILVLFGVTMLWSGTAEAGWFLNNNQEALKLFEAQDYAGAAQKFEDEQWKGAAAYKSGDYEHAFQSFSLKNDATSLYNQGNSLAKSGKINEAIKKYEEVLKLDAGFEDAKFNLEYLKKQQQQQNQQQQNRDNKEENKDNQQQSAAQQNQSQDKQQEQQQSQPQQSETQEDKQQEQQSQNRSQSSEDGQEQQQQQQSQPDHQQQQQTEGVEQQNDNAQAQDEERDKSDDGQQDEENSAENQADKAAKAEDGEQETPADIQVKQGQETPEETEKRLARMYKFREIPEDKGGLLRAFIKKEYEKNRYKD